MSDDSKPSRPGSLPLVGGVLALDFCNTASGRGTPGHQEHLRTAADVLAWARHAGIIDAEAWATLQARWHSHLRPSQRFLARTICLRDAIHDLVAALARQGEPERDTVDVIGREHSACLAEGRLTSRDGGFGWSWSVAEAPEAVVLGPIAGSAMALMTTADRNRLKQCSGHHCGWLFLDVTKSNNRRWCEMEVCGNRAKQKRRRAAPPRAD